MINAKKSGETIIGNHLRRIKYFKWDLIFNYIF